LEASSHPWKMDSAKWRKVQESLKEGWSPEQISGRYRLDGVDMAGHRRIHEYIGEDRSNGGTLWKHLRRCGRKPNRRGGRHTGRGLIPGRLDISERPDIVEEKTRVGDREPATAGRS